MHADEYARGLLASLALDAHVGPAPDPVHDWACSGAMWLTGTAEGAPMVAAGPAVALRGVLMALGALAPGAELPGMGILGERAANSGLRRRGAVSCGQASRLLPTADGAIAVTLAREADLDLVPAVVGASVVDAWESLTQWLSTSTTAVAADRLSLLGLPFGVPGEVRGSDPVVITERGESRPSEDQPVVVNLGSLWAAPLAGSLLQLLGCRVLKVESEDRPDGARQGSADFYRLLNGTSEVVVLDWKSRSGREDLASLLASADVVIEGSRPRALAQMGLAAEQVIAEATRTTWISITGHGREHNRVGFGDDAAVAGGLVRQGCFVGDAIADPLTGAHAALAAWAGILRGGTRLVDVALSRVAAAADSLELDSPPLAYPRHGTWWVDAPTGAVAVAEPRPR